LYNYMQTDAIIYRKESKMHAMNTKSTMNNMRGFTLVELMIVVFLSAIAVIAIYRGYTAFSHSADVQEQIIEMQQNLRIGMYWLEKDLRRAGMTEEDNDIVAIYNIGAGKLEKKRANEATFLTADASTVEFGMDLGSDWVDPAIGKNLFATNKNDDDGDGVADAGSNAELEALKTTDPAAYEEAKKEADEESRIGDNDFDDDGERIRYTLNGNDLQREAWDSASHDYGPAQTIITNVAALEFVYLYDGDQKATPPVPPERFATPVSSSNLRNIDSIEIALVIRTTNEDYRYTNNEAYSIIVPPPGVIVSPPPPWDSEEILAAQNDNFRRRLLVKRIKIRNARL